MIYAIISILLAFIIAFGRQSAVFGKIEQSLWFFSNYETKRLYFSISSILFGGLAFYFHPENDVIWRLIACSLFLITVSYLFDFKYIFPEVKFVIKETGKKLSIKKETEVLGTEIGNIAIAYPLEVIMARHIINDQIDLKGIVASYCAICRSGLIFSSEIDNTILYFKVSGVWRRNMIMVDNKTQSLWQQATGECIYGKLKGKQLTLLSGENTNWKAWAKKHPNSLYATKCTEARKGYLSIKSMMKPLKFATRKMTPPGFTNLDGLHKRETVFGIHFNGISKAYPANKLVESVEFYDSFDSKTIKLKYDAEAKYLQAINVDDEKQLIVEKHWWLGWKEFHSETQIWNGETELV